MSASGGHGRSGWSIEIGRVTSKPGFKNGLPPPGEAICWQQPNTAADRPARARQRADRRIRSAACLVGSPPARLGILPAVCCSACFGVPSSEAEQGGELVEVACALHPLVASTARS